MHYAQIAYLTMQAKIVNPDYYFNAIAQDLGGEKWFEKLGTVGLDPSVIGDSALKNAWANLTTDPLPNWDDPALL